MTTAAASPAPQDAAAPPAPGDDADGVVGDNYWDEDFQYPQSDIRQG